MLQWLRALARNLIEKDDYEHLMISMPLDYLVIGEYFALSSMGIWSKEWFISIANAEIADLMENGKEFFPWWSKCFDSHFFKNCAITKMWVDVPWHAYANEYEKGLYYFVIDCCNKAKQLDSQIKIPDAELSIIRTYLDNEKLAEDPSQDGIGFKKRLMQRSLTGTWTAAIPGFLYDDLEDDGSTVVYWFQDRTVRGSSFSLQGKDGRPLPPEELLEDKPQNLNVRDFDKGHLKGYATIEMSSENGKEYFTLSGSIATMNNMCHVTICFDKEEQTYWAVAIWESVSMPEGKYEKTL